MLILLRKPSAQLSSPFFLLSSLSQLSSRQRIPKGRPSCSRWPLTRVPVSFSAHFTTTRSQLDHVSALTPQSSQAKPDLDRETGWKPISIKLPLSRRIALYQALAKSRLSSLIVLTTMASYALCPVSAALPASSLTTLLATATGTFLCSASANTLNQLFEAPFDAQMSRTRGRPLVRRLVSTPHATMFASLTGAGGTLLLATAVNPTTALLGALNLVLYAFVYTPLKRISIVNTWLGSLVGSLPALMGATAAGAPLDSPASWLTAALLFVWQFPHFNALAHTLRRDYARAGYQMMANVQPALNARVSLRYALAALPLSSWLMPLYGLTTPIFGLLSLIPNLCLIIPATRLWLATPSGPRARIFLNSALIRRIGLADWLAKKESKTKQEQEAKKLFWASLIHLPSLLILMMACRPSNFSTNDDDIQLSDRPVMIN